MCFWPEMLGSLRVREDSHGLVIRKGFMEEAEAVLDLDSQALDGQRGKEGISRVGSTGAEMWRLQQQSGWMREQREVRQHRHPHHHIY